MFIQLLFSNPLIFLLIVALVMFSICVHEYAHAQVALWQGDDTAAREGHLSLNPLVQMGWQSMALCCLLGLAWGAVPVDRGRFRHRYSDALVSFAGPGANFLLAIGFAVAGAVGLRVFHANEQLADLIFSVGVYAGGLNVALGLFNLLPVPILDGWSVFKYFIPAMARVRDEHQQIVFVVLIVILFSTNLFRSVREFGDQLVTHLSQALAAVLLLV